MHIDEFIDDPDTDVYASWFFNLHRLQATLQFKFASQIEAYKLFCTFEGKRYRCTGASRLGDVWLTDNFSQQHGYQKRVDVSLCSNWESEP